MPTARTLTSTAAFWLEALDAFDIRHDGPQWTTWTPSAPPTIEDHHQLTELVRDGIVIQQFLLELVTRSGMQRNHILDKLNALLATQPV